MAKLINLHTAIVEAHNRENVILDDDKRGYAFALFESNFTVIESKRLQTYFVGTREENDIRFGSKGDSMSAADRDQRITMIRKEENDFNAELKALKDSGVDLEYGSEETRNLSALLDANLVPAKFLEVVDFSLRGSAFEFRKTASIRNMRYLSDMSFKLEGGFTPIKMLQAFEFISRIKGAVMKTIEGVYGDAAVKKVEEILKKKSTFNFKIDLFAIMKVVKLFDIDYVENDNGTATFTFKFNIEEMLKLIGPNATKAYGKLENISRTIFEYVTVACYNAAQYMMALDDLSDEKVSE